MSSNTPRVTDPENGIDDQSRTIGRRDFFRIGAGAAVATAGLAGGPGTAAAAYDGWLDEVDNYDGTVDFRGNEEVQVAVGAGNGLLFDPPAILIDPGTTVVWEWTGEGGQHNVAEVQEGTFTSELTEEAGHIFEYTFEEEGTYPYVCEPHDAVEMKGVVAVGDTDDELIDPAGADDAENGDADEDSPADDDGADPSAGGITLSSGDLFAIAISLGFAAVLFALAFVDINPPE